MWAVCAICVAATPSPVSQVGQVRVKSLIEASGLATSRAHPGVYWTHNDGHDGILYALNIDGAPVGQIKVDAKFKDWEDIAIDADKNLYLADTGNNSRQRKSVAIYRIDEPDPRSPHKTHVSATWKLGFPEEPFNCESLFIHDGNGYLISKVEAGNRAALYRFSLAPTKKQRVLERLYDLPIVEPVTAADISADGQQLAVLGQRTLYVFPIESDISKVAQATPRKFTIPPIQAEGCCFNPDGVLVIAESGEILQVRLDSAPATTQSLP